MISKVKVTQTIHPDDDDGKLCDAADHTRAVGLEGVTIQNQFLVMNENSLRRMVTISQKKVLREK
jgi:hypothetical protein